MFPVFGSQGTRYFGSLKKAVKGIPINAIPFSKLIAGIGYRQNNVCVVRGGPLIDRREYRSAHE